MTKVPNLDRVLQQKTVRDPAALTHFLAAFRELGRDEGDFSLKRLEALLQVEEHFQALVLYDQLDYLRAQGDAAHADRDFALTIQRIWLEAANSYQRYLRARNLWAGSREAVELMFRVTGLALNAIHGYVKWGSFLSEPGRSVPWKQLHALYALAESEGFSRVPFVLHAAQPSFKPSVQSLYLRTLVLDLLNAGNLTKTQVEIADGWFSSWCGDYSLDAEYSSRLHIFFVDLGSESGLHLLRRDAQGETTRYVRADGLKVQMEEVQAGLRHGRLFAGYGAGAVFTVEEHVALLAIVEKLYGSILSGTQNRIEERTHFEDREVDVAPGIELLLRKMREGPALPAPPAAAAAAPDATMDTIELSPMGVSQVASAPAGAEANTDDPDLFRWRVLDLSTTGYGLLVDRPTAETVVLGGLLGVRNQENGGWIVAQVVRKLPNRVRGEMLLGVEVLAYRPVRIELQRDDGPAIEALYLPGPVATGRSDSILLRVADFSSEPVFRARVGGTTYRLRLNRIIRKGADWLKVRFEVVSSP